MLCCRRASGVLFRHLRVRDRTAALRKTLTLHSGESVEVLGGPDRVPQGPGGRRGRETLPAGRGPPQDVTDPGKERHMKILCIGDAMIPGDGPARHRRLGPPPAPAAGGRARGAGGGGGPARVPGPPRRRDRARPLLPLLRRGHGRLREPAPHLRQAREFVAETGLDAVALAVSVGTVHGLYRGEPRIDLDRLAAIHDGGAPGPARRMRHPASLLRERVARDVGKVNVNTEISGAPGAGPPALPESIPLAGTPLSPVERNAKLDRQRSPSTVKFCVRRPTCKYMLCRLLRNCCQAKTQNLTGNGSPSRATFAFGFDRWSVCRHERQAPGPHRAGGVRVRPTWTQRVRRYT